MLREKKLKLWRVSEFIGLCKVKIGDLKNLFVEIFFWMRLMGFFLMISLFFFVR